MRAQAVLLMVLLPIIATADDEPLSVVVREGPRDGTVVERLRGQLADLDDITLHVEPATIEPTLDGQLVVAERLGTTHDARIVVWFVSRGRSLAVAIATPGDHRLFVREIPPAAESVMAEAAAIAVRGAVRAIAAGGTIGVEVRVPQVEPAPVEPPAPKAVTSIDASLGWQVALDGGASAGAHALVQRTTIARGGWGTSLALMLGVPLEWSAAPDVALDVARSGALLGGERRLGGGVAFGVGAGALLYHRSTSTAPPDLSPTPSNSTIAFASGAELLWRAQLGKRVRLVACVGVDIVLGAPEAAVERDGTVEALDAIRAVQPRASAALEVGSW